MILTFFFVFLDPAKMTSTSSLASESNGSSSGLATLGGGIPASGQSRFGATLSRPATQYHTPESGVHLDAPRGGTGTISKISSLSSLMSKMSIDANGAPSSPYDTYAKPKTGNGGSAMKGRSLSGLGLGPRSNSGLGFGRSPMVPQQGLHQLQQFSSSSNRLDFEPSDTESFNGTGRGAGATGHADEYLIHRDEPMETDIESVVTTSTEESDDLDTCT